MNTMDVRPNLFLRQWILNAIGIFPVAAIASLITWTPVAILMAILGNFEMLSILTRIIFTMALLILPGASIGYAIGEVQRNLMRDYLKWDIKAWINRSIVGGFIGGLLIIGFIFVFENQLATQTQLMAILPLFILPISIAQWTTLRRIARDAWLWILANVVGAIVFNGLLFMNQNLFAPQFEPIKMLLLWLAASAALGVITGIVILWLYERPITEWDADNAELAPVYVEVRTREDR